MSKKLKKQLKKLKRRLDEFEAIDESWAESVDANYAAMARVQGIHAEQIQRGYDRSDKAVKGLKAWCQENNRSLSAVTDDLRQYTKGQLTTMQESVRHMSESIVTIDERIEALKKDNNASRDRIEEIGNATNGAYMRWKERLEAVEARFQTLPPSPEPKEAMALITSEMTHDMLGLAGVEVPIEDISHWYPDLVARVFQWAAQQHLMASDNHFEEHEILATPHVLVGYMGEKNNDG